MTAQQELAAPYIVYVLSVYPGRPETLMRHYWCENTDEGGSGLVCGGMYAAQYACKTDARRALELARARWESREAGSAASQKADVTYHIVPYNGE